MSDFFTIYFASIHLDWILVSVLSDLVFCCLFGLIEEVDSVKISRLMALGKRTAVGLGSGVVRYTRSMSGKRVAISNSKEVDFPAKTKELSCKIAGSKNFQLEALPQDILVRIFCCVDHDDLKQLFRASKIIREATIVAKKWHFEFNTPTKKTFALQNFFDVAPSEDSEEIEAPNAPKQSRIPRSRLSEKKLANISVALFVSLDEEDWPRRNFFQKMEIDL